MTITIRVTTKAENRRRQRGRAADTGWTLDSIEGLSFEGVWGYLSVRDARLKSGGGQADSIRRMCGFAPQG